MEKEVLNKDNIADGWYAVCLSPYYSELLLWKEEHTNVSAMGN